MRDAAQTAVTDWRALGYAKAEISGQAITANHPAAQLDVDLTLTPGPRLRFGDVRVSGDTAVKHPRVRQIAGLPRGDRFSPADVDKAAAREAFYGEPYGDWKAKHQREASAEQLAQFEVMKPKD